MKNGKVTIDGKTFTGRNVQINNNKVVVDGVTQDGELVGDITVTVHGDVETLSNTNGKVNAVNVGSVTTTNGDVTCQTVKGNVRTTNGDVKSRIVGGTVNTVNGDITR